MKFKTVLVTGSSGFIGGHLCENLRDRGIFVKGFSNSKEKFSDEQINGDISDFETLNSACKNVDLIFHLAGTSSPQIANFSNDSLNTNIQGTANVMEAAFQNKVKRVVFASSAYVYGAGIKAPIPETLSLFPNSKYGVLKLMGEDICNFYARKGLSVSIARLFNVFGDRQVNRVIPDLIAKASRKSNFFEISGNAADTRDFLHVSHACDGLFLIASKGKSNEAYNLASGVETDMVALSNLIISAFKKIDAEFNKVPKYNHSKPTAKRIVADIGKIKRLGFVCEKINANQIVRMIK
ncbi:MAG: NAD(P)-dependent oxidoreductase [Candidatus Micrarchaeota archaeon]